jgi:hypothetical protein|nr:MAG TPA: nin one binding protein [Caudoviricetes sp.]
MRLIDGDALIEKFNEKTDMAECLVDARTAERFATFCALADAVEEMPTVDAEVVVHGQWGTGRFNLETGNYEEQCTCCRNFSKEYGKPYCPNCGAKMDEKEAVYD